MTTPPDSSSIAGSPSSRSVLMKRVRRQDTAPEMTVRRALHAAGLRYRLHDRRLPGTPDIVLPRFATVVMVHGCFWHGHDCRHGQVRSKTRTAFWDGNIAANRDRDQRKAAALSALGWHVETVWECQVGTLLVIEGLIERIRSRSSGRRRSNADTRRPKTTKLAEASLRIEGRNDPIALNQPSTS
ncbi:MAG TPA: very short patch repair endonuclease [Burkholderiaceae bacterium]|nr:very short patch repair endonuclease [Burkholderiaceae bacterium]HMX10169.1 very short patch repair endonuclease [Burkholderiaceae bacterium]HMY99518.1 very short patch repair endonuclease [Burkholderiaceae bacterium]